MPLNLVIDGDVFGPDGKCRLQLRIIRSKSFNCAEDAANPSSTKGVQDRDKEENKTGWERPGRLRGRLWLRARSPMHGISPLLGLGGDTRDDASLCASLRSALVGDPYHLCPTTA